jgi:hypothetical protein
MIQKYRFGILGIALYYMCVTDTNIVTIDTLLCTNRVTDAIIIVYLIKTKIVR